MKLAKHLIVAMLPVAVLASCHDAPMQTQTQTQTLTVLAASSLQSVFADFAKQFEAEHPNTHVQLRTGGSGELRAQLEQGLVADVFAAADPETMQALAQNNLIATPTSTTLDVFAHNRLVVVLAEHQRTTLRTLADLAKAQRIVVGDSTVPIGRYTAQVIRQLATHLGNDWAQHVERAIVSRELNVKQVLAKVASGEADAAFVYVSDVAHSTLPTIALGAQDNITASYPIAVLNDSAQPTLAAAFISLVRSEKVCTTLTAHGFLCPGSAP